MDYKKYALIAGLVVVSYLLLLQWNEDYPNVPQSSQPASETIQTDIPGVNDLPVTQTVQAGPGSANLNDDIPEVNVTEQPLPVSTSSSQLINIQTPIHTVQIDLLGGDITHIALPKYPTSLETPDDPFVLLRNDVSGVYIAQIGLTAPDGPDVNNKPRPLYQSAQTFYKLNEGESALNVDLFYVDELGVEYTKRFIFSDNDYLITVEYIINNTSDSEWHGTLFGQIKRDQAEDPSSGGGFGMRTYLGAALTTSDDAYKKVDFDDMEKSTEDIVKGGWIAFSQHYFLSTWIPDSSLEYKYVTRTNSAGNYLMEFISRQLTTVPANETGSITSSFWAGPKDQYRLEEVSPNLGLTIDYGMLWFVAQPIFWLLINLNNLIGNYGLSIIAMTLVIKLMFSWLSSKSYRSMAKMRKLTPKVTQLKERFGDDKQGLMKAQMELWKKEKVNPMGGCLPMLLQMPVLIGIYWVLNESVELRHATFFLWYNDLSAMDPYFILPLIMGASMFVSQLMTPMTTMDPMQAKMLRLMPVFFTFFFLWFPSGLVLYWLVSNVFNIAQQWYINKKVDEAYQPKKS